MKSRNLLTGIGRCRQILSVIGGRGCHNNGTVTTPQRNPILLNYRLMARCESDIVVSGWRLPKIARRPAVVANKILSIPVSMFLTAFSFKRNKMNAEVAYVRVIYIVVIAVAADLILSWLSEMYFRTEQLAIA